MRPTFPKMTPSAWDALFAALDAATAEIDGLKSYINRFGLRAPGVDRILTKFRKAHHANKSLLTALAGIEQGQKTSQGVTP